MLSNQTTIPALPENPEEQLRGLRELYQNPFYLYLLAQLAAEEVAATAEVFQRLEPVSEHFKCVGFALGLVRMKDIHIGKIQDLEQQLKENVDEKKLDVKS